MVQGGAWESLGVGNKIHEGGGDRRGVRVERRGIGSGRVALSKSEEGRCSRSFVIRRMSAAAACPQTPHTEPSSAAMQPGVRSRIVTHTTQPQSS